MKNKLILLSLLAIPFCRCQDKTPAEPFLTIDTTPVVFSYQSNTKTISCSSNAEIQAVSSQPAWCKAAVVQVKKSKAIEIYVMANNTAGQDRTATVTVTAGTAEAAQIEVKQGSQAAVFKVLADAEQQFGPQAANRILTVQTNLPLTVTSSDLSWCTVNVPSSQPDQVVVTVTSYYYTGTLGMRTAEVAIAAPGFDAVKIKVSQQNQLWRGFNFAHSLRYQNDAKALADLEQDFKWMADWGFNFVRIPLSYRYYIEYDPASGQKITAPETVIFREEAVKAMEDRVYLAHRYGLHVNLCLHRAPGYCVTDGADSEPFNLWSDEAAQQAFYAHWDMWAKRFKNVSPELLSFNLVNEPSITSSSGREIYRKICAGALEVIHQQNPDRIVIADGSRGARDVVSELADLKIAQSVHGYEPHTLSHYGGGALPTWPGVIQDGQAWNRQRLETYFQPWITLAKQGVPVHCGETGCGSPQVPHAVFLAWMSDVLDILNQNDIGWALWEFRGWFGVLNTGRTDVQYENFNGHQLDRQLLNLLQKD